MAMEYTEEQLNNFDKATIVQLFLVQQSQLHDIDRKLQLLLEQVAVLNNNRFGKASEKLDTENQICFMEVDGNIVFFNEAEAVASLDEYVDEDEIRPRGRKTKGRREKDIQGLPVNLVEHKMSEEELIAEFGEDGWYELEDEIYRRYSFTPISLPFMIICIRSFMTIMCFRQMKLRSWYQKKTGLLGTSITCGCTVPVRCMRTDRSYCTITSHRVMQAIQEISLRSSRESV